MMALVPLLLAIVVALVLLVAARPGRGAIQLVGAALLIAVAGYTWQGHPRLAGSPAPARSAAAVDGTLFAHERRIWLDEVGADGQALDAADGLIARGDAAYAIGILRGALARAPRDMTLWVGLGNALTSYADGAVTPAALHAFDRAMALSPRHPAPRYLLGLAYAQSGDLDGAAREWRALLRDTPADAPWKPIVAQKLAVLARLKATMR